MLGHATILRWRTALCVSSDRHKHEMKLLARFFRRPRVPQPRRVSTPRRFLDMSNRPPYRGRTPGLARLPERLPSIHKKVETALVLLCHKFSVSVPSGAAWATRERRGESGHQSPSHRCNRVRSVAFRPQRRILCAGNLRVRQIAGTAWWHDLLRGESFLARRSRIRRPQCKGWRDGGSRAIPVLQNVPARPPA
jgi:hypothetical protein